MKLQAYIDQAVESFKDNLIWNTVLSSLDEHGDMHYKLSLNGYGVDIHFIRKIMFICRGDGGYMVSQTQNPNDLYYVYFNEKYYSDEDDAKGAVLRHEIGKVKRSAKAEWKRIQRKKHIESLPILYCNICGEGKKSHLMGIVYVTHTCVSCAKNMGEECRNVGVQHI